MRYRNVTVSYDGHCTIVTATLGDEHGTATLDMGSLFRLYGEQFYRPEKALLDLKENANNGEPKLVFQDSGEFVVSLKLIDAPPTDFWTVNQDRLRMPKSFGLSPKIAIEFRITDRCLQRSKGDIERYERSIEAFVTHFRSRLMNG